MFCTPMLFLGSPAFNVLLYVFTAFSSIIALLIAFVRFRLLPVFAKWWSRTSLGAYELVCGVSYEVNGQQY